MFKIQPICEEYINMKGMIQLNGNLRKSPDDLGVMYYTMLNIWMLSFHESSWKYFIENTRNGIIKNMINVIQIISREKILRVSFSTFRVSHRFY